MLNLLEMVKQYRVTLLLMISVVVVATVMAISISWSWLSVNDPVYKVVNKAATKNQEQPQQFDTLVTTIAIHQAIANAVATKNAALSTAVAAHAKNKKQKHHRRVVPKITPSKDDGVNNVNGPDVRTSDIIDMVAFGVALLGGTLGLLGYGFRDTVRARMQLVRATFEPMATKLVERAYRIGKTVRYVMETPEFGRVMSPAVVVRAEWALKYFANEDEKTRAAIADALSGVTTEAEFRDIYTQQVNANFDDPMRRIEYLKDVDTAFKSFREIK